ncbi:MAG: hypothetical protein JW951_06465 [Lentisphaerae bacterium]|nr:hypothetical protein [Lentisphaerota bacterium]
MKWALLLMLSLAAAAPAYEFSRYRVILDREPFGTPPPRPDPAAQEPQVVKPARSFVDELRIRMCAITEHPDFGVRVGFLAAASPGSKEMKSYYMEVGETRDGITVADAEVDDESALLQRGGQEAWIFMNQSRQAPAGAPSISLAEAAQAVQAPERKSYAERLRERREARRKHMEAKEPPQLTGEDLEKHLKEYQMELIRAGGALGPPLPIPLTKEMDDQLVAEGVLPPLEE